MKAEINNGNKAKFFALYLNQKVLCDNLKSNQRLDKSWNWSHEDFFLELKPLSLITDEDAEVIDLTSEDYNENGWFDKEGIFYYWSFHDVDYLRSKGYALPFMELSVGEMIEAGWIRLVQQ